MSEALYQPHPDVLAQDVDGELVLLHLGTEDYYGLNEVGARIWEQLSDHGSVSRTIEAVAERYGVEKERVSVDVDALVAELKKRKILQARSASVEPAT